MAGVSLQLLISSAYILPQAAAVRLGLLGISDSIVQQVVMPSLPPVGTAFGALLAESRNRSYASLRTRFSLPKVHD
jgi:hypothetical protein